MKRTSKKGKKSGRPTTSKVKTQAAIPTYHPEYPKDLRNGPVKFQPFVETWGLRGDQKWRKSEHLSAAVVGRFLNPKLDLLIQSLQHAFDTGQFPYRSLTHPLCRRNELTFRLDEDVEAMREWAAVVRRQKGKKRSVAHSRFFPASGSASGLSALSSRGLERAKKAHRALREQWRRLGQIMLSAVACRDVGFFKHVAEIISVRGYERFMAPHAPAEKVRVAVAAAIQSLQEDDEIRQLLSAKPEYGDLKRDRLKMIAHDDLGIRCKSTFRPVEIEERMLKRAAFKALLPNEWENSPAATRERTIRRHAQVLGIKLKRGNARS